MIVNPTHTCFDDSLDTLCEMANATPNQTDDLRLVHGICIAPDDGHQYSHAWCEFDTGGGAIAVVFVGIIDGARNHLIAEQAEYYQELRVVEVTRYTVQEALMQNLRTNHYGPWDERYQALTADGLRR